jgi:hypothetical protein
MAITRTTAGERHGILVRCRPIVRACGGYEFDVDPVIPAGVKLRILQASSAGREIPLKRIVSFRQPCVT